MRLGRGIQRNLSSVYDCASRIYDETNYMGWLVLVIMVIQLSVISKSNELAENERFTSENNDLIG